MKEHSHSIGDQVRIVTSNWGVGKVGIVKSVNNIDEVWVDFPDGSGGLFKLKGVVLHKRNEYLMRKEILVNYKAGEMTLAQALNDLEEIK